jgi:hypothetical protein
MGNSFAQQNNLWVQTEKPVYHTGDQINGQSECVPALLTMERFAYPESPESSWPLAVLFIAFYPTSRHPSKGVFLALATAHRSDLLKNCGLRGTSTYVHHMRKQPALTPSHKERHMCRICRVVTVVLIGFEVPQPLNSPT